MKTAESLEHQFLRDRSVSITLISETNALLFTPMLAEVAGSSLEPSHISTPLRSSLPRTNFVRATVESVDLEKQRVKLTATPSSSDGALREIPYDQLVLALGAVSNYLGMADVQKHALDFKSLLDAIRVRNRVIEMFERADSEANPAVRRRLLTFAIAGGASLASSWLGHSTISAVGFWPIIRTCGPRISKSYWCTQEITFFRSLANRSDGMRRKKWPLAA